MHSPEIGNHPSIREKAVRIASLLISAPPFIVFGGRALLEQRRRISEEEEREKLKVSGTREVFEAGEANIISVNGELEIGPSY